MKLIVFSISFLLGGIFLTSCEQSYCRIEYAFDFPLKVSADTINVGDTIWYSMDVREPLMNYETGDVVNLKPFDLYFKFKVGRLDTAYANYDDHYFAMVAEKGTIEHLNNPEFGTFWKFDAPENKVFRIGLVALHAGIYRSELTLPYFYTILEDPELRWNRFSEGLKVSSTRCEQFITPHSRIIANDGENNYPNLQQGVCQMYSPIDTSFLCWDANLHDRALQRGYYAFVVR